MLPKIFTKYQNICIIAHHPDDEILGLGGTIAFLIKHHKNIHIIFTTNGEKGIKKSLPIITSFIRAKEFQEVKKTLLNEFNLSQKDFNLKEYFLNFPDGKLEQNFSKLKEKLNSLLIQIKPDLIFLPTINDWHNDHKISHTACFESLIDLKTKNILIDALIYEVWSPFAQADIHINITEFASLKRKLIQCYASQVKQLDFESSIMGLNAYRSMFLKKEERLVGQNNYVESFCKLIF